MPRIVYTTLATPEGEGVVETRHAPSGVTTLGLVREATYLEASAPSFWQRIFGGGTGAVELRPPFDRDGHDHFGLFEGTHEPLEPGAPIGSVRHARGVIRCLSPREPGDAVVLRDAWLPSLRVTSALHFSLDDGRGPPVAIAFAQSPLVVAPGSLAPLASVLVNVDDAVSTRLRNRGGIDWRDAAELTVLQAGDSIEVLGVVAEPSDRRYELSDTSVSYRDAPTALVQVLGDAPGVRMVLRRIG